MPARPHPSTPPDRPPRVLSWALVLYPPRFRRAYAREMLEVYAELRRERQRLGRPRLALLWIRTLVDVVRTALLERFLDPPESLNEGVGTMEGLLQDVRLGLRTMRRSPVFSAVAVATLALGIGANTAVFSFVNALLLARMPLPEPERVVRLFGSSPSSPDTDVFSYPTYKDLRDRSKAFEGLAAFRVTSAEVGQDVSQPEARVELVSGNYFTTLRVGAVLGRALEPSDDDGVGQHPVVVLGHDFWKGRLGADPAVIGKTLPLNGQLFTVVGVAAAGFRGSYPTFETDMWVPVVMVEAIRRTGIDIEKRGWGWLEGIGRLAPQVSVQQAQADLDLVTKSLVREVPDQYRDHGFVLKPAGAIPQAWRGGAVSLLGFFLLLVGLVLLVACVNIAGVLLARATARRRETAVRKALGASRSRLLRQWVVECMTLALLGGAAGLLVAAWVRSALLSLTRSADMLAGFTPELTFDFRVLGFVLVLVLLVGTLFGLIPGLSAGRRDVVNALKEESGGSIGGRRASRSFSAFVVVQIGVSLVLLVTAGLLLRTLREAQAFDLGFQRHNLLLASINLRPAGYTEARGLDFYRQLWQRLRGTPGVQAVTYASIVPLSGDNDRNRFYVEGQPEPASLDVNVVGPGYFGTIGTRLVAGRELTDAPGSTGEIVVNESLARRFWPGESAVGHRLHSGKADGPALEIVGVAHDARYNSLDEEPRPCVFGALAQFYTESCTIHIRTAGDPRAAIAVLREAVKALDPAVGVRGVQTFDDVFRGALLSQSLLAPVTSWLAGLALILSAIGLYGLMSYSVTQRTREIGLRMALGAERGRVLALVVRKGMALALMGLAIGLAGAFAGTRFLSGLLFRVSPTDPWTFAVLSVLILMVALVACLLPARRAARVDPMTALRHE